MASWKNGKFEPLMPWLVNKIADYILALYNWNLELPYFA
jgi:hypothetical protein